MCDRILVLADGRIACDLPSGDASKELIMRYADVARPSSRGKRTPILKEV